MDLSRSKVFVQKVFGVLLLINRERVDFPYLRSKGVIKINLMIVGARGGNMDGCFF